MNMENVIEIAISHDWELAPIQPDEHYVRLVKNGNILDVWYTGTARFIAPLTKTQYFRDANLEELLSTL